MISTFELQLDLQQTCIATTPDLKTLKHWIHTTLSVHPNHLYHPIITLTLRVVDEPEMQTLNNTYRKKNKPTNVLAFPNLMPDAVKQMLDEQYLGDIILCAPIVEMEAQEQHKRLEDHWAHMIVHSTLHLLGYDHILEQEAQQMESYEQAILKKLGFSNPYQSDYKEQK